MDNKLSQNQSIQYLKTLEKRIPNVSDQVLIDLVNGFQISQDILLFRERRGFLDKLIDLTGQQDRLRQLRIDKNLIEGQKFLTDLLVELNDSLSFSYVALIVMQDYIKKIGVANTVLEKRVENLEKRVENLEVVQALSNIVKEWSAGGIYIELPWVVQIALLVRAACSNFLSAYELRTGQTKYRKILVDEIILATRQCTDNFIKVFNPNDCISLTQLLLSCNNISSQNKGGISDIEVLTWILDLETFWSTNSDIISNIPYLMTIWKTLDLLSLPQDSIPPDPVKAAIQISRNISDSPLYHVNSLGNFIAKIVNETADSYLSLLKGIQSSKKEKNAQNIIVSESVKEEESPISPVNFGSIDLSLKNSPPRRFGLVLAGGGAKGAYEAGVLKYMAEIELSPYIIAGTSIGALNGAVVASHQSFQRGVDHVLELWTELGKKQILKLNKNGKALFQPKPLEKFLRQAVKPDQLRKGIELWVAAFPSQKISNIEFSSIEQLLIDVVSSKKGRAAHYFHVQKSPDDENLYEILLASAAIPVAFPPREIDGQKYVDGFLGDNVPLKALAVKGCTDVIVIHLENGSLWSRYDFPKISIIEIRPRENLGGALNGLNFNSQYINQLKNNGYNDAQYYLGEIRQFLKAIEQRRALENEVTRSSPLP